MASIYLASKSPRRKELLEIIGTDFEIFECNFKEEIQPNESVSEFVERNTKEKALHAVAMLQAKNSLMLPVLTADTAVAIDNQIFGKPVNKDHCISMLMELSGRSHKVFTCVALANVESKDYEKVNLNFEVVESEVFFRQLNANECSRYWDTKEPLDKAGGYAIQGYGSAFVEKIIGSYSNIVGLPIFETCRLFEKEKINYWLS